MCAPGCALVDTEGGPTFFLVPAADLAAQGTGGAPPGGGRPARALPSARRRERLCGQALRRVLGGASGAAAGQICWRVNQAQQVGFWPSGCAGQDTGVGTRGPARPARRSLGFQFEVSAWRLFTACWGVGPGPGYGGHRVLRLPVHGLTGPRPRNPTGYEDPVGAESRKQAAEHMFLLASVEPFVDLLKRREEQGPNFPV